MPCILDWFLPSWWALICVSILCISHKVELEPETWTFLARIHHIWWYILHIAIHQKHIIPIFLTTANAKFGHLLKMVTARALHYKGLEISIIQLVRLVNLSTTFENVVLSYVWSSELKIKWKQLQIVQKRMIVKLCIRSCRMCLRLYSVENTF